MIGSKSTTLTLIGKMDPSTSHVALKHVHMDLNELMEKKMMTPKNLMTFFKKATDFSSRVPKF